MMDKGHTPANRHSELTQRITELEARGGGTLELGDGIYGIDRPLHLPRAVSLCTVSYTHLTLPTKRIV